MKILLINVTCNIGSTGIIVEEIGRLAQKNDYISYIAYGRNMRKSTSIEVKIGNSIEIYSHVIKTRLFDSHGLGSAQATKKFIYDIEQINPDVIHLHNIHGYYLNYPLLFSYLKEWGGPVVWTLHDCWSFTGHCSHFERIGCKKWQTHCSDCSLTHEYPSSFFYDRSSSNFDDKKNSFLSISNQLTLVPVSDWLSNHLSKSFFKDVNRITIKNGIDLNTFITGRAMPSSLKEYLSPYKYRYLSVSNKGLNDIIEFSKYLNDDEIIVIVGLSNKDIKKVANVDKILALPRVNGAGEMSALYANCNAYLNFTYGDTYPTTNLEAIASGTPVITYKTGGSPESVGKDTGFVIEKADFKSVRHALDAINQKGKSFYVQSCREFAEANFNKNNCFAQYVNLYNQLLERK